MAEGVKTLKLERFDSVARITIDRADRLNALGADEMRGLHRVMQDVGYDFWVDYVEQILARFQAKPRTVLDLACGTGNTTL
ncbi:MAG: hypothetical protein M1144_00745, partial [Candidatus Thermoplasmatota archaeon]|nr:hypothetical protein [Candidatus Thermoplasmatota archaeon]